MPIFSNVFITPRVRASLHKVVQAQLHKKFWHLLAKLKEGKFEIPGLNVEKLYSKSRKLYSARLNKEMRLIFSMRKEQSGSSLIIHELNHHDDAYERIDRQENAGAALEKTEPLLEADALQSAQNSSALPDLNREFEEQITEPSDLLPVQLFKVPHYLLSNPDRYIQYEKTLDRFLILSEEQEEILDIKDKAMLVQGPAGTGKTTLALFNALNRFEENSEDAVYLFTYHEELACVCRAYKVNLLGDDDESANDSGIKVFSYIEFCRHHLRKSLRTGDKSEHWIDKSESIQILKQILSQKPRWSRNFIAADLYGLIYSILKGRFVPGSESLPCSKEDYERIFRDYGRMPEAFEEILEIFSLYQQKLDTHKLFDEADIIKLSYETLKERALLAEANRRLWIVIDEVQDFTELEWKSILLFWENHCKQAAITFPFMSGDVNQNISRSGFRWQELEAYLQGILKGLHRPNSLKMITLHQNYRNSKEIHQLASFIRRFSSDTSDLGLPPVFQAEKPRLVLASDKEFLEFLQQQSASKGSSNPIVVLVENEDSLNFLRRELSGNESVFLLSLSNSKGMEFEDVIIHRAFSSFSKAQGAEVSRFFDLWYMGITRARKNLLLVQSNEDQLSLQSLLQDRAHEFYGLIDRVSCKKGFDDFWQKRELHVPDYNVIFLERKIAQDLWHEFLKEKNKNTSDNECAERSNRQESERILSQYAKQCRDRALKLWQRCLDYSSLGTALMQLGQFQEASTYLQRSGRFKETGTCLEACRQFAEAASQFEKVDLKSDAARCWEQLGEFSRAAELFEKDENWIAAARNYHNSGNLSQAAIASEKAGLFRSAADIYRVSGEHKKSAELYARVEDYRDAAEMYLQNNNKIQAARCFQKAKDFSRASELFEEENNHLNAAECARMAGSDSLAADLFLKAGNLPEAARSFEDADLPENAADIYLQTGEHKRAAQLYEQAGNIEQAALMYEQAREWETALKLAQACHNDDIIARCHENSGRYMEAAQMYLQSGMINNAAACFERANDFLQASELYLKTDSYAQAANCLARTDRKLEAARLHIIAGQIAQAYELVSNTSSSHGGKSKTEDDFKKLIDSCLESRRTAAAAQLLELKKDYLAASEKYKDCLMLPKAAECLEKYGKHREAASIYLEAGDAAKAAESFKHARLFKEAAECFERTKNWSEAKKMYERCGDRDGIARCKHALNWF